MSDELYRIFLSIEKFKGTKFEEIHSGTTTTRTLDGIIFWLITAKSRAVAFIKRELIEEEIEKEIVEEHEKEIEEEKEEEVSSLII